MYILYIVYILYTTYINILKTPVFCLFLLRGVVNCKLCKPMKEIHFNKSNLSLIMTYQEFMEINRVYLEYTEQMFPNFRYLTPLKDRIKGNKPSSTLTNAVVKYLLWSGNFAERINTTGIMRGGKWTYSGSTPGSADISAIIKGKPVKIEIKYGKDRQSEAQKDYEAKVTQAGAEYWLVRNMTDFFKHLNKSQ